MASIGKCLLFYLKYPVEMERLYEADEPDTEGLPDAEVVREKLNAVGAAATSEAVELVESCAIGIQEHLESISNCRRIRNNVRNDWGVRFNISQVGVADKSVEAGVFISTTQRALIPWLCTPGGRRAAKELSHILGPEAMTNCVSDPGTVGLAQIRIPIPECPDDPVDGEPLVAEVVHVLSKLTAEQLRQILAMRNRREDA